MTGAYLNTGETHVRMVPCHPSAMDQQRPGLLGSAFAPFRRQGHTNASACRLEARVARFRGVSSGCAPLASRSLSARLLRMLTGDDGLAYIELGP